MHVLTQTKAVWAVLCKGTKPKKKTQLHKNHTQEGIHRYVASVCFDVQCNHNVTSIVRVYRCSFRLATLCAAICANAGPPWL